MLIKLPSSSSSYESEVTPESVYLSRRALVGRATGLALMAGLPGAGDARARYAGVGQVASPPWFADKLTSAQWARSGGDEALTPFEDASSYNNFFEFGPEKGDPARQAVDFEVEPWSVAIDGEVARPGRYSLDTLCQPHRLEERIYRLRCVEAWSMVIPWLGFPLSELLRRGSRPGRRNMCVSRLCTIPSGWLGNVRGFP